MTLSALLGAPSGTMAATDLSDRSSARSIGAHSGCRYSSQVYAVDQAPLSQIVRRPRSGASGWAVRVRARLFNRGLAGKREKHEIRPREPAWP